ncbi:MAG TPA: hypothetical protein VFD92_15000 [Candidatus Binatia bacterium]|nr:hypothetical protein [Candidatus Binatia bacterium]
MTADGGAPAVGRARIALEAAIVGLVVLLYLWPFRLYGFDVTDEGVQLVQIERAAAGERPYVDFETSYTPGYFAFHAALWRAFGAGLTTTRTFGVLFQAATVAAGFAVARVHGARAAAVAAALVQVAFLLPVSLRFGAPFNTPYPGWLAAALALASQAAVAALAARRARGAAGAALLGVAAGAAAGLAFSVKPNCGVLALGGAALAASAGWDARAAVARALALAIRLGAVAGGVALVAGGREPMVAIALLAPLALAALRAPADRALSAGQVIGGGGAAVADLAALALGFAIVVAPWLARLASDLGLAATFANVLHLEGSVVRAYAIALAPPWPATVALAAGVVAACLLALRPGRARWAAPALAGGMTIAAALAALEGPRLTAENACLWLGPVLLGAALATVARDARPEATAERALLAFAAVYALQLYPRPDLVHVAMGAPVVVPAVAVAWSRAERAWAAGLAREVAGGARAAALVRRRAGAAALAVVSVLAAGRALPTLVPRLREPVVDLGIGERAPIVVVEGRAEELAWLGAAVREIRAHSTDGDALFAFPDVPGLGFLAGRRMPFYFLYFVPGRPDRSQQGEIVARLEEVRPAVVALAPPSVPAFAGADAYFDRIVAWIDENTVPVASAGPCAIRVRRADDPAARQATTSSR